MFNNYFKVLFLVALLIPANQAMAVTQSMTAHIAFATPLSLTQTSDMSIDTAGRITGEGRITVAGTKDQIINISVDSYAADGSIALQNPTCSYDGGDTGSCAITNAAAPGAGKTLLLGMQGIASDTPIAATTVSVVYQ